MSPFSEKRQLLNKTSPMSKMVRLSRKLKNKHLKHTYKADSGRDEIKLKDQHKIELRQILSKYFPNAVIDLVEAKALYQYKLPACSFVSFLNLCKMQDKLGIFRDKNITQKWRTHWNRWGIKTGCEDIGSSLDMMVEHNMLKTPEIIQYIPLRSSKLSENNYNTQYWNPTESKMRLAQQLIKDQAPESISKNMLQELQNYIRENLSVSKSKMSISSSSNSRSTFKIPSMEEVEAKYDSLSHIYEVANLIESLLDKRIPVQINSEGHSRVCVGYNDEQLIMMDSWGENIAVLHYYYAGFSVINKWKIYSHARDISYLA